MSMGWWRTEIQDGVVEDAALARILRPTALEFDPEQRRTAGRPREHARAPCLGCNAADGGSKHFGMQITPQDEGRRGVPDGADPAQVAAARGIISGLQALAAAEEAVACTCGQARCIGWEARRQPLREMETEAGDDGRKHHRTSCGEQKWAGEDALPATEGPLNVAPGESGEKAGQQQNAQRLNCGQLAEGVEVCEHQQRPVPEIERIGDKPGEHDRAPAQQPADQRRTADAGIDQKGCTKAWEKGTDAGERRVGRVPEDTAEDEDKASEREGVADRLAAGNSEGAHSEKRS